MAALAATAITAMDDHMLAVGSLKCPNRAHHRSARALAIAGLVGIDMARMQTRRAMIPVAATRAQGPHHAMTVDAAK